MSNENATLLIFDTPLEIGDAVRRLQVSGCRANGLSAMWRDQPSQSGVSGYYRSGNQMKYWGELDFLWDEILEAVLGWACFSIPDIGRIVVVGPLAEWVATALANAAIFGDMSAIGMGLYSVGVSRKSIALCEESLQQGKCALLLNGSAREVHKARQIIDSFCHAVST